MSKFSIILPINEFYFPHLIHYLNSIPNEYVYNNKYSLRHPYSLFYKAYFEVMKAFINTINSYEKVKEKPEDENLQSEFLEKYELLLHNLSSYYDEMYLIIKTLCPPKNKDHNVAFEWLRLNQYNAGNNFHSDTAIIEKYWKDQINAIKHNNQCIRYFHGYINNINIIIGYYIEGVDREGVITPDLKIHKLFKNCCTAYSINYHFRLNIMYIYQIAELLLKNIKKHLKVLYNKNIKIQIDDKIKNESTVQVLDYVSKLTLLFFPDEANLKKYLKIIKNYNGFFLSYPHTDSIIQYPGFHIKGRFMIEKYHLKYTFPYFKG